MIFQNFGFNKPNGNFAPTSFQVDYMLVGAGGGGGWGTSVNYGGGGGGGGIVVGSFRVPISPTYSITINTGVGGDNGTASIPPSSGGNSTMSDGGIVLGTKIAYGGGSGATGGSERKAASTGGSGGGGNDDGTQLGKAATQPGSAYGGLGNSGGNGNGVYGGGGGGAASAGSTRYGGGAYTWPLDYTTGIDYSGGGSGYYPDWSSNPQGYGWGGSNWVTGGGTGTSNGEKGYCAIRYFGPQRALGGQQIISGSNGYTYHLFFTEGANDYFNTIT